MLDGPGDSGRLATALRLAKECRATTLVISPEHEAIGSRRRSSADVRRQGHLLQPSPATTQGEAEFVGRLARQDCWTSVALVTMAPLDTRARLRVSRCFPGKIYAQGAVSPAQLLTACAVETPAGRSPAAVNPR
jgi:hypothetical protein